MKMKVDRQNPIVLIQSPAWGLETPPLALALLTGILFENKFQVKIFDLNIRFFHNVSEESRKLWQPENGHFWCNEHNVKKLINDYQDFIDSIIEEIMLTKCDVVGFSVTWPTTMFSLLLARLIKTRNPEITIVFGGPQTSFFYDGENIIQDDSVDATVLHEGDVVFPEILRMLEEKGSFSEYPGLVFKNAGKVINGGVAPPIKDLNTLPFAEYSQFDLSLYKTPHRLDIYSSRSCINNCYYCAERSYFQRFRCLSGKRIYQKILYQIEKHPAVTHFYFSDSVLNGSIDSLRELSELLIANQIKITWGGQAVIRKEMSFDLLQLMHRAGCIFLFYGMESASARVLRSMNKTRFTIRDAKLVLRNTHIVGIKTNVNFMFGYPTESQKDFYETVRFFKEIIPYIDYVLPSQSCTAIIKNTYLYENIEKFKVEPNPDPVFWRTIDGRNTYPIRYARLEFFYNLCKKENIPILGISDLPKEVLAKYYYEHEKDYKNALICYKQLLFDSVVGNKDYINRFMDCCRQQDDYTQENMRVINKYHQYQYKYKASIVIATRNRGEGIILVLNAIRDLEINPSLFEVIIVDTCPPDEHKVLLDNYRDFYSFSIKYIVTNVVGLSWARNRGIVESSGEYVVFLDDDALVSKSWLANIIANFESNPEVYALGGAVISEFSSARPAWLDNRLNGYISHFDKDNVVQVLTYNEYPRGANCAFRREVFRECGLFLDFLGLKGRSKMAYEEIELCYRIEKAGHKVLYIPNAKVYHLIRPERLSPAWFRERFYWQGRSEAVFRILHLPIKSGVRLFIIHLLAAFKERDNYQKRYFIGYAITMFIHIFLRKKYILCK